MAKKRSDPDAFGLMAEPSAQSLEALRLTQHAEQADPELQRKRERRDADLNKTYRRIREYRGTEPNGGFQQEMLLKNARRYEVARLKDIVAEARCDVPVGRLQEEVKLRMGVDALRNYVPTSPRRQCLALELDEFTEALWTEGFPSLEDYVSAVIQRRSVRGLNTERINRWINDNGYTNPTLARALKTTSKTVSSLRNDGASHGWKAISKLANLMGCEFASELFLD